MIIEIGDNIKKYRKLRKMTQKELAEKINKSYSVVQKYELKLTQPPIEVLEKIADVLCVPLEDLMKRQMVLEMPDLGKVFDFRTDIEKEISEKILLLNETGQRKALDYITDLTEQEKYTHKEEDE